MKKITRRQLLHLDVSGHSQEPAGSCALTVDAAHCTGCGLCAAACGSRAIFFSTGSPYEMLFHHESCSGCGECVSSCPEKCLSMQSAPECKGAAAAVLFRDDLVPCRACGKPVGPRSMVAAITGRLSGTGAGLSHLELCPECRTAAAFQARG